MIGYAARAIPRGSWIYESMVVLPEAPPLHTLPLATKVPAPLPPLEGYNFPGLSQCRWQRGHQKPARYYHQCPLGAAGVGGLTQKSLNAICYRNTRTSMAWWG
ncbi:hypothetical protein ACLBOM_06745 [Escherichia coli]